MHFSTSLLTLVTLGSLAAASPLRPHRPLLNSTGLCIRTLPGNDAIIPLNGSYVNSVPINTTPNFQTTLSKCVTQDTVTISVGQDGGFNITNPTGTMLVTALETFQHYGSLAMTVPPNTYPKQFYIDSSSKVQSFFGQTTSWFVCMKVENMFPLENIYYGKFNFRLQDLMNKQCGFVDLVACPLS